MRRCKQQEHGAYSHSYAHTHATGSHANPNSSRTYADSFTNAGAFFGDHRPRS
jgi:hypothetical protein